MHGQFDVEINLINTNMSDINLTVKTAFCNTQIAEAFAAAVVASSKGKDHIIKDSYDLEIQRLTNELKTLKNNISEIQTFFTNKNSNEVKVSQEVDNFGDSEGSTNDLENSRDREWETLKKYIYEHFRQQAEFETKIKELESSIINGRELCFLKREELSDIEKNLENSTSQITTLVCLIDNFRKISDGLEERISSLENKVTSLDDKMNTHLQIVENIAKLPNSIMDIFRSQSRSWESFSKILKQLSKDVDYIVKKNEGSFEENSNVDELAASLKLLIDAMRNIQPILALPN